MPAINNLVDVQPETLWPRVALNNRTAEKDDSSSFFISFSFNTPLSSNSARLVPFSKGCKGSHSRHTGTY